MIIEIEKAELDLSNTRIEYKEEDRGSVMQVYSLVQASELLGYQIDLCAYWDAIDNVLNLGKQIADALETAIEFMRDAIEDIVYSAPTRPPAW